MVQIETQEGLDNLDEIAAVDGVDGVFIGPADLSAALGRRRDRSLRTLALRLGDRCC